MTTTNYFEGCKTDAEIKTRYRELTKKHHPDLGGELEEMQAVNAEYEARIKGTYQEREDYTESKGAWWMEQEQVMMDKLASILKVSGITVELLGSWIWITGDTKPVKEELKELGCRWSKGKSAWYWRNPEIKFRKRSKKEMSLDDIRSTYDSNGSFKSRGAKAIA